MGMNFDSGQYNPEIANVSKESGGNLESIATDMNSLIGFDIPAHDSIVCSYTGDDLTGVVYKLGAATVATLTLVYVAGKLTTVTKT